ncbi:ester cyclase [uncultured Erythrobacter sp.]|uniref:nuclear transport factor 2 family protein n=1 Tax=uncultured Erythrobacter sp. TaxID=263913 RepID=UPI002619B2B3|nr:ester cyclase [uncultured Erythrobacter sp.]
MSQTEIAQTFFDRYNAQDVPAMVAMFEQEGTVEYVPFDLKGPVEEVGPGSWGVLIASFPDLSNSVRSIREGGQFAFVDVDISGTQEQEAFGVPSLGRSYKVRHFFIFEINPEGKIRHLTCFWDNAQWYRQLGKTDLDD